MAPKEDTTDQKRTLKEGTIPAKKEEEGAQRGEHEATDERDPTDHGGLPDRDLKKNLGCG